MNISGWMWTSFIYTIKNGCIIILILMGFGRSDSTQFIHLAHVDWEKSPIEPKILPSIALR